MDLKKFAYRAPYLEDWNKRMSQDRNVGLDDNVIKALLHEMEIPFSETNRFRNQYSYEMLWQSLERYSNASIVGAKELDTGLKAAFKVFAKPKTREKLKAISLEEAPAELIKKLDLKNTSAGLVAYGRSKYEAMDYGLLYARETLLGKRSPKPALAGVRTQFEKTRLVWMYPLDMTILEGTVARPVIDVFKSSQSPMTFGDYSSTLSARFRRSAYARQYHVSIDYSKFDASVKRTHIQAAFSALRTWFDLDQTVFSSKTVGDVFDLIENYFIFTPIVMPNRDQSSPSIVYGKAGGVPSGSYFTQWIDSFVNFALIMQLSHDMNLNLNSSHVYVLGDDCLFFSNRKVDLQVVESTLRSYGYITNHKKGSFGLATDNIEYLGRTWKEFVPVRKLADATERMIYPESYRKYSGNGDYHEIREGALGVIRSFMFTAETPELETTPLTRASIPKAEFISGFTRYLMKEGMLPAGAVTRRLY